jgi:hypothetical protein
MPTSSRKTGRIGAHWCVAADQWELRFLGISRPALGAAGRSQRWVVWLGDLAIFPGPHTRTARLRLSGHAAGDDPRP